MTEMTNPHIRQLKNAGYKLTHARLTVLNVLEASSGHVTSTQILDRVNEIDSSIGRASVFRTLDTFTRLGIIRPVYIDTSITPSYVIMHEGHHHHMICTNCNRIIEIQGCGLDEMAAELERRLKVQLTGHLVEFYGLCENCALSPDPSSNN